MGYNERNPVSCIKCSGSHNLKLGKVQAGAGRECCKFIRT